jgi:hypothetical protein
MTLELHLKICGVLLIILGALHPAFARYFRWKEDLLRVSLLTRQVFWVHTLFIVLILIQFGILSLAFAHVLVERSLLAKIVLAGLVSFWSVRLLAQHLIYSPALWRGNRFNTIMHLVFSGLWTYFAATYGVALWNQWEK